MDSVIKNYELFYDVMLACTMLSNDLTDKNYVRDAKAVIDFCCRAYGLDALSAEWQRYILEDSGDFICTLAECLAHERTRSIMRTAEREPSAEIDTALLNDIKSDVLKELSGLSNTEKAQKNNRVVLPSSWFDYQYYLLYRAPVRYAQIRSAASLGWRQAARVQGIMLALGIGCDRDPAAAIRKWKQCFFWCDLPSARLIAYLYRVESDVANAELYGQAAELEQGYLREGLTEIPEDVRARYSKKACTLYEQVSSIYRDVCCANYMPDINYSFVEVMMMDRIPDSNKMHYINNYDRREWINETNPEGRFWVQSTGNKSGF